MNLKTIIIEDEKAVRESLKNMLTQFCEGVEVLDCASSVKQGVKSITVHDPDLVFLDIKLPNENGFSLFNHFPDPSFDTIFTTAHTQYAIKAFKLSAVDYLLKPIDLEELRHALSVVQKHRHFRQSKKMLEVLKDNLNERYGKLTLPTKVGYSFIEIKDIIYCEAKGNYTLFFMLDGEEILVSKTLRIYAEMLEHFHFFRISRSYLVNLNHVKQYNRTKNARLVMKNGALLPVSIQQKELLLKELMSL